MPAEDDEDDIPCARGCGHWDWEHDVHGRCWASVGPVRILRNRIGLPYAESECCACGW
jgi:hypothetical protein